MDDFFTQNAAWHEKIEQIYALLECVKISEGYSADVLHLRKIIRILSIGSHIAIDDNLSRAEMLKSITARLCEHHHFNLSLSQVCDVINGKPILAPSKDIEEVQNVYATYELILKSNPYSVDDFLTAHRYITSKLNEGGRFRTGRGFVENDKGDILHEGADFNNIPILVSELFACGKHSDVHPLIKSSIIHFMIEDIHPFSDGNGRIGRLWQTLVLTKWNVLFWWIPVENIIYNNREKYNESLQRSYDNTGKVDCAPFIGFMLDVLIDTIRKCCW